MANIVEQFEDIKQLLNDFYTTGVERDPHAAFEYNVCKETDTRTVCLYYSDDLDEWIICVINPDLMEEDVVYASPEYNRAELLTKFTNIYTALILEQ